MIANVNPETGIRYGVASLQSLADWVFDEFFYHGTDVSTAAALKEWEGENPEASDEERDSFLEHLEIDECCYSLETEDGMKLELSHLGGAPLVFVLESPVMDTARECSPCVPNAGNLDSKDPGGFECYSLPPEWFCDSETEEG